MRTVAHVQLAERSHLFGAGTSVAVVRRHFGLAPHNGNLFLCTASASVKMAVNLGGNDSPLEQPVDEASQLITGCTYAFRGDPSAFPTILLEDAVFNRNCKLLGSLYTMAWCTYFFLVFGRGW